MSVGVRRKEQGKDEVNRKQEMGVRKPQEEGKEGDRRQGREGGVLNRERKELKKVQTPERREQQTTLEPILSNLHIH